MLKKPYMIRLTTNSTVMGVKYISLYCGHISLCFCFSLTSVGKQKTPNCYILSVKPDVAVNMSSVSAELVVSAGLNDAFRLLSDSLIGVL